ncbi:MAG: CinA family protein [Alphaproteobacteria bacterium]|nr:CinA family protein [Alphaproteobacteria bacterium]
MLPDELITRARRVVELFGEEQWTLALAESCTGGLIAACITAVPGSSRILERGFITYSNTSKIEEVFVPAQLIKQHGAVSAEVASAMAQGARTVAKTNVGLSVTGIAGPDGGSDEKPVGLVFLALATADKVDIRRFVFDGDRNEVRRQAVVKVLSMLISIGNESSTHQP